MRRFLQVVAVVAVLGATGCGRMISFEIGPLGMRMTFAAPGEQRLLTVEQRLLGVEEQLRTGNPGELNNAHVSQALPAR